MGGSVLPAWDRFCSDIRALLLPRHTAVAAAVERQPADVGLLAPDTLDGRDGWSGLGQLFPLGRQNEPLNPLDPLAEVVIAEAPLDRPSEPLDLSVEVRTADQHGGLRRV